MVGGQPLRAFVRAITTPYFRMVVSETLQSTWRGRIVRTKAHVVRQYRRNRGIDLETPVVEFSPDGTHQRATVGDLRRHTWQLMTEHLAAFGVTRGIALEVGA